MIVVFDIGNVLVRWNPRNLFRKVFDDEARMERFLAAALAMDFIVMTDIVKDFSRAVAERAKAFPEFAEQLHLFDARWIETIGGLIEENVALMRRLKRAGRPVYGLSNFASVKFALARKMFDFLNEFDECVISGDVGVVKPDPRIFEILFERVGRPPGELRVHRRSARQRARRRGARHGGDPVPPRRRSGKRARRPRRPALIGSARPNGRSSRSGRRYSKRAFARRSSSITAAGSIDYLLGAARCWRACSAENLACCLVSVFLCRLRALCGPAGPEVLLGIATLEAAGVAAPLVCATAGKGASASAARPTHAILLSIELSPNCSHGSKSRARPGTELAHAPSPRPSPRRRAASVLKSAI